MSKLHLHQKFKFADDDVDTNANTNANTNTNTNNINDFNIYDLDISIQKTESNKFILHIKIDEEGYETRYLTYIFDNITKIEKHYDSNGKTWLIRVNFKSFFLIGIEQFVFSKLTDQDVKLFYDFLIEKCIKLEQNMV